LATLEQQDLLVSLAILDPVACLDLVDHLGNLEQQEVLVFLDCREIQEDLGFLVTLGLPASRE